MNRQRIREDERERRKKSMWIHQSVSYTLSVCYDTKIEYRHLFFSSNQLMRACDCVREREHVCVCGNRFIYTHLSCQRNCTSPSFMPYTLLGAFVCVLSLLAHFNTVLTTSEQWAHDTPEIPTDGCRHSIASLIIQCLACRFVKIKLPLTSPQSVFRFVFFDSGSKRLSSKRHTFARIESI